MILTNNHYTSVSETEAFIWIKTKITLVLHCELKKNKKPLLM